MTIQFSVEVRNARLDAIETAAGVSPKLRLYSGAPPANTAAARTGTLIAELALPSDWAAAAANGAKALAGSWAGTGAAAAGTGTAVGHFALMSNDGTKCHMQGTVTATGSGGDLTLDNVNIAQNQAVNITTWTLTDANA